MRFGFKREKPQTSAGQVTEKEEIDAKTLREAINSAKATTANPPPSQATYAAPHEINENDSNAPDGSKQVGILILPETQNVMDFWVLYQSIQKSGVPNHVGIFNKTNGVWLEEQLSE